MMSMTIAQDQYVHAYSPVSAGQTLLSNSDCLHSQRRNQYTETQRRTMVTPARDLHLT